MKHYEHRQAGHLIMGALVVGGALVVVAILDDGFNWIAGAVFVLIVAALLNFCCLTVVVWHDVLEARFGPGIITKKYALRDLVSARAVRNRPWWGWGMRMTPHGWLYSVSGLDAVEVEFHTGRTLRIGTDEPQQLQMAIEEGIRRQ